MTDQSKLAALLDKLGSDDAFRDRLSANPSAALGELGIDVPDAMRNESVSLPSKEEVQARKGEWLAQAHDAPHAMMIFFCLK
jgi:putative modified peptide